MGSVQRLAQKSAEILGVPKLDQSPQRSIGVCGGGIDKKSGLIHAVVDICIYPLTNARSIVSALQGQFADEHVGEGKAERAGRIAREPDGQWDIDKTRRRLTETADPNRSPLAARDSADGTPFARLKVAQLALKVEAQRLSLDETKRRLLDVTEANAALDEIGSTMRDALLNWPARVSGLIAAEISVDPHLLQTILQSHINDLLTEAADRFDPAGLGGDRSADP